jgi:hypothetical protein
VVVDGSSASIGIPASCLPVHSTRVLPTVWGELRMRFLLRRVKSLDSQHKANGTAAALALLTIAFLHLECPPRPAGADTIRQASAGPSMASLDRQKSVDQSPGENLTPEQLSARNLTKKIELLQKGIALLKATPDYTAQFTKRELVNGELMDEQTMTMKLRHEPFSVYLKWRDFDAGREVMYVDGVNDGKMLVKSGTGLKARLPAILMPPDSSLAMQEARYPITRAGLLALAETIVEYNAKDLEVKNFSACRQVEDQMVGDRKCHCFVVEYLDRNCSKDYRKSVTMIDKEHCAPIFIKNFGWPNENLSQVDGGDLDEATLIEHYTYSDVRFGSRLSELDFDQTNADYRFRRQ